MNKINKHETKKSDEKLILGNSSNNRLEKPIGLNDITQARKMVNQYIQNFIEFKK